MRGKHASKRGIRRTAAVWAAGLAATGLVTFGAAGAAHASTPPALSARQIMAACERGEPIGIDGRTYVCVRVGTRAGMHRCEADLVSDIDQGFRFNWDSKRATRGVVAWVCGRDLLSLRQFRTAVWFAQRQESLYDS